MTTRARSLRGAAAAAIVVAACGLGGAALAHEEPQRAPRVEERIIIIQDRDGEEVSTREERGPAAGEEGGPVRERERVVVLDRRGPGGPGGPRVRTFNMRGPGGPGGPRVRTFHMGGPGVEGHLAGCGGDRSEVDQSSDNGTERTRVIICNRGGPDGLSGAQRAGRLEQALARINANEHLSAESKARLTSALREALESLRRAD